MKRKHFQTISFLRFKKIFPFAFQIKSFAKKKLKNKTQL